MYIPYAISYFLQRVYLMCSVSGTCGNLTIYDYMTNEMVVIFVGNLIHIPLWFFTLIVLDVKKSGGRGRDAFKFLKVGLPTRQLVNCIL